MEPGRSGYQASLGAHSPVCSFLSSGFLTWEVGTTPATQQGCCTDSKHEYKVQSTGLGSVQVVDEGCLSEATGWGSAPPLRPYETEGHTSLTRSGLGHQLGLVLLLFSRLYYTSCGGKAELALSSSHSNFLLVCQQKHLP